jgi:hypothetical protein
MILSLIKRVYAILEALLILWLALITTAYILMGAAVLTEGVDGPLLYGFGFFLFCGVTLELLFMKWSCSCLREKIPLGLALALQQPRFPEFVRLSVFLWWFMRFFSGLFFYGLFLFDTGKQPLGYGPIIAHALFSAALAHFSFAYLMLAASVYVQAKPELERLWSSRPLIDIIVAAAATLLAWLHPR